MSHPQIPTDSPMFRVTENDQRFLCDLGDDILGFIPINHLSAYQRANCVNAARCWWLDEAERYDYLAEFAWWMDPHDGSLITIVYASIYLECRRLVDLMAERADQWAAWGKG